MKNYVTASNSDGRIEAFYIGEDGTVMHIWQINPTNKTSWSEPNTLTGGSTPLKNAVKIGAATDYTNGKITVVATTNDNKSHICYQTVTGSWTGWFEITQN